MSSIDRLRARKVVSPESSISTMCTSPDPDCLDAAALLERAKEVLRPFAYEAEKRPWLMSHRSSNIGGSSIDNEDLRRAHALLKDIENG